jgi:hypothetical protein
MAAKLIPSAIVFEYFKGSPPPPTGVTWSCDNEAVELEPDETGLSCKVSIPNALEDSLTGARVTAGYYGGESAAFEVDYNVQTGLLAGSRVA